MKKANADIREAIRAAGLKHWQIAEALKISDNTLSRRMRHEMAAGEMVETEPEIASAEEAATETKETVSQK